MAQKGENSASTGGKELYAVVSSDGSFWKGYPPTHAEQNWADYATKIGAKGYEKFTFLFFQHDREFLYAVTDEDGGVLWKGFPPTDGATADEWLATATQVGTKGGGWHDYKLLFSAGRDNDLYAVQTDGTLLRGRPPLSKEHPWEPEIVAANNKFHCKFMFLDPSEMVLYYVTHNGSLMGVTPPKTAADVIRPFEYGHSGWDIAFKFLFFGSVDLYAVATDTSDFVTGEPPPLPSDAEDWQRGYTKKIGNGGWTKYKFLFF